MALRELVLVANRGRDPSLDFYRWAGIERAERAVVVAPDRRLTQPRV